MPSQPPDFWLDALLGHDRDMTAYLMSLSAGLSDDELDREFDIGHRTLRRTFDHLILATDSWTGQLTGEPVPWKPDPASIAAMQERHQAVYARFEATAHTIAAEGQEQEIIIDAHDYPQTKGLTVLHVILHNHMHRSEVLHILQRLGVEELPEGDPQEWGHYTGRIPTSPPES
ncbi:MAG: DinB family protein [Thermomicrobiales bacterium]